MSRVVVMNHDNGIVRDVILHDPAGGTAASQVAARRAACPVVPVDDLGDRDLMDACASLCAHLEDDDFIAWRDHRQPALTDPLSWPARLTQTGGGHPHEIRHLGFTSTPTAVLRSLQAVAGEDPFVVPSGPQRVTWLLGSAAGVGSVRALRRAGVTRLDGEPAGGIALRWAVLGWRAFARGVLPRHDEHLGKASPIDRWSTADRHALINHRWGKTRRGPIRLARLLPPTDSAAVSITPPNEQPGPAGRAEKGDEAGIDVVIPTLERPGPLADVLDDLAAQDLVPSQVLVVEQRPDGAPSALDNLRERAWPFALKIETIRELGASQARNRALRQARARWVALLDDDVRLAPGLLAAMVAEAEGWGADALSVDESDLSVGESDLAVAKNNGGSAPRPAPRPVVGLGSGRSLVRRRALVAVGGFDQQIEGWGEDMELGLRMHHAGYAVLESQHLVLVHLKAPRGGFRTPRPSAKPRIRIPPLPSPLIVYRWLCWMPPAMLDGAVRSHLVRAARGRRTGLLALPWLWLRYRAAASAARTILAQGPHLLPVDRESQ